MKLLLLGTLLLTMDCMLAGQSKESPEDKCCCTTYDTGQCLIKTSKDVEEQLGQTYKKALARWPQGNVQAPLQKSQEAWFAYRKADCDGEYETYSGGSMASNMSVFCEIRLTRQRIQEIKNIYLPEH